MKKGLSLAVTATLLWCGLTTNVSASSYINEKGVKIDSEVVEKLRGSVNSKEFNYMPQDLYDHFVRKATNGYESEVQYYVVENTMKDGKVTNTDSFVVSEEEYNEKYSISPQNECLNDIGKPCVYVDAFKVWVEHTSEPSTATNIDADIFAVWDSNNAPSVKSHEVLAFRYSGFSLSDAWGVQFVDGMDSLPTYYNYGESNNFTKQSNGIGVAIPLKSNGSDYSLRLSVWGKRTGSGQMTGAFLDAKSTVSLAAAKNYTFASNGLGGVVKYSSSATSNKYRTATSPLLTFNY